MSLLREKRDPGEQSFDMQTHDELPLLTLVFSSKLVWYAAQAEPDNARVPVNAQAEQPRAVAAQQAAVS